MTTTVTATIRNRKRRIKIDDDAGDNCSNNSDNIKWKLIWLRYKVKKRKENMPASTKCCLWFCLPFSIIH